MKSKTAAAWYAVIKIKRFKDSVTQEVLFDERQPRALALERAQAASLEADTVSVSVFRGRGTIGRQVGHFVNGREQS